MDNEKQKRSKDVLRTVSVLLCAGLLYAFFCRVTGWGIPCPVYAVTGFKCPGCGGTRMCLALLSGNFSEAFRQNRAVLLLLPMFAYIAAAWCVGYIRRGDRLLRGGAKWCAYAAVFLLLIFGVVRNCFGW